MATFKIFEYLKIEVNRPSTKQFFRKARTIFGAMVKNGLFIKKRCTHISHVLKQIFLKIMCGYLFIEEFESRWMSVELILC